MRHDKACVPTRSAPPAPRLDRFGREAATRDQPRDHRVRVPHLACPQLVATPDRPRNLRNELQDPARDLRIVSQAPRALDRFVDVRDNSATPAAHLVAEDPEMTRPAATDCAFG